MKSLRKVELKDLNALIKLLQEFWKTQLFNPKDSDILEDIHKMLDERGIGRVIEVDGNIAGFIYVNEKFGYINNIEYLYIDKAYRGKGLATFAIEEIKKLVFERGNDKVQIEVVPNNYRALKLYHKLGFTSIDTFTLSTKISGSKREELKFRDLTFLINHKEDFKK